MKEDVAEQTIKVVQKKLDVRRRAIFTKNDLKEIVIQDLPDVGVNQRALIKGQILKYLWERGKIEEAVFKFPSRPETRYVFGDITSFELAQSLKPNAYLNYRAAMYLNGLSDDPPNTIYINVEQAKQHQRNKYSLTQLGIDRAFRNKSRISNEIAEANGITVCVTHGQKTDQLGVEKKKGPNGEELSVTNLERTLIDITVRPIYAGGPKEVLKAYKRAKQLSVKRLLEILNKMDYVYPYHQAVGFYLEASGNYSKADIAKFKTMTSRFDFYLDYRMKDTKYSEEWKIYYPADLL